LEGSPSESDPEGKEMFAFRGGWTGQGRAGWSPTCGCLRLPHVLFLALPKSCLVALGISGELREESGEFGGVEEVQQLTKLTLFRARIKGNEIVTRLFV